MAQEVEQRLSSIEIKLDRITETIQSIAVQQEKINRLEERMHGIWTRYDDLVGPNGVISTIRTHQASCPRTQLRWVWVVMIPMGLSLLAMAAALLK